MLPYCKDSMHRSMMMLSMDFIGQRNLFDKNKPTNVVGTDFRVHTSYVQWEFRRNDGPRHRSNGPTYRVSHRTRSQSQTRNYERSMGQRAETRRPIRTIETIQENIHTREKCFSQSSPILQHQTRGQRYTR